jgi:hypothetical protein
VQAPRDRRQRFQQLFFPDGIAFDGNRLIGTGATAPPFGYLRGIRTKNEGVVDLTGIDAAGGRKAAAASLSTVRAAIDRTNVREMVAQICPRWNRLRPWFELVGAFKDAA